MGMSNAIIIQRGTILTVAASPEGYSEFGDFNVTVQRLFNADGLSDFAVLEGLSFSNADGWRDGRYFLTYQFDEMGEFLLGMGSPHSVDFFRGFIVVDTPTATTPEVAPPTPTPAEPTPPAPTITPTATPDTISVTIDGTPVNFPDQSPAIVDGRTLVPVRGVFEALGFEVEWNAEHQVVSLARYDIGINLGIGGTFFSTICMNTKDTANHSLDVPAQLIGGRTMLPIRALVESAGYSVDWDGATSTVVITS
jgi:hypothetical protein